MAPQEADIAGVVVGAAAIVATVTPADARRIATAAAATSTIASPID